MKLTLGQAAKTAGVSKGTISNALKSGRMSGQKNAKGQYEIDPAELDRVFPKRVEASNMNEPAHPLNTDTAALEREIAMLREMLAKSEENVERERSNADEWRKQAQTLALTDQRSKEGRGFLGLFKKTG